jgi:hypothetical protein
MNINLLKTSIVTLSVVASLASTVAIAGNPLPIEPINSPQPPITSLNFPQTIDTNAREGSYISGQIKNNATVGQPKFACNNITIYVAKDVTPPSTGEDIQPQKLQQIGASVTATGDINSGCQYKLPLSTSALNMPVYLIATSPKAWTTYVDSVNITQANFKNPIHVSTGKSIINMNMQITTSVIK